MRKITFLLATTTLSAAVLGFACDNSGTVVPTGDAGANPDGAPVALPPLESQLPPIVDAAKRRDNTSSPVVFDAERGGVWTANADVGTVSYVDVDARKVIQEIAVGKDIRSIALSPDAQWIAAVDREGARVALIDAESRQVRRYIPVGTHPRAAIWDSANPRWLYVAVEDDDAVVIIDRVQGALLTTIAVGRLPSGLAVSRQRRELYVTHRIDAKVSVVDLKERAVSADIALADQAADPDATKPQGKPFAFESLAWAADGNLAWLPHQLLAPTHPFEFQKTLFPAVSVVDLSDARAEIVTDPASGVSAGRKVLFDAMNILDATGNTSIVSQPCAAALHPNGLVGYVLACASEDLLVFDPAAGVATDLIRNLPGDHPVGITLDDTGQRAFILSDQSHTLSTFDTRDGNPTKRISAIGDPIALVASDPIEPELREGFKLFFRANSSKGDLATTGNNWMSCGGCHLDGLVTTNLFFFETLRPVDPRADAQIGHVGMKDLFSTAPTPGEPAFNPHDVLVALLDQGGLAPDRSGAHREGQIDPSAASPAAAKIASRLARAIARDLPVGPSWLLSPGLKPNTDYDGAWCGNCHKAEYDAWSKSAHAHAAEDPMVLYGMKLEQQIRGPQYSRLCAGCHDPVSVRVGDTSFESKRGITCLGCHDAERLLRAGGNADLEMRNHDWDKDHKAWGLASLEKLRKPEFCGGCHQQFVPGTGLTAISTLTEYQASAFAQGKDATTCVDCHLPVTNGVSDHRMAGGNLFMGQKFGDADMVQAQTQKLKSFASLRASSTGALVVVDVLNKGAGHAFPTGVTDIREAWIELQAVDAQKKVVARYGGPGADGLVPQTAARFGMDIARPDGTLLFKHELSESTRIPFDFRLMPQVKRSVSLAAPSQLPPGAVELDAVLMYRNLKTQYYRAATGDPAGLPPETELARTKVERP